MLLAGQVAGSRPSLFSHPCPLALAGGRLQSECLVMRWASRDPCLHLNLAALHSPAESDTIGDLDNTQVSVHCLDGSGISAHEGQRETE